MANQLASFDPVGSFQGARSKALSIEGQEQDLTLQPARNELAQLKLSGEKTRQDRGKVTAGREDALIQSKFMINAAQALRQVPVENRQAAAQSILTQAPQIGLDPNSFDLSDLSDQDLDDSIVEAGTILQSLQSGGKSDDFTLSPGQKRFRGGREIASVAPESDAVSADVPGELLIGLDEGIARKGAAAFKAAGGGKDGLKAFNEIVDKGGEQARRAASPQILKQNFPNASPAEQEQLQATMDAAKTTESGLKSAEKLRTEQKRLKKAKTFQVKAVELINKILVNPQLGDVLGSIEGRIDIRLFSDEEAELIADIDEASNILTADNMDLMTGVLSESDIAILRNLSGGALTRTRTEDRFTTDLTDLRDRLASEQVVTVDDQAAINQAPELEAKRARLAELRARAGQ